MFYNGWRVEGVLTVSRSLGNKNLAKFLSAEAEVKTHEVTAGDEFFILATDGLWSVVDSQAAVDIVRAEIARAESADMDVSQVSQRASEALVEVAYLKQHSMDNICCVVVFLR